MNDTFIPTASYNKRKWYLINCKYQKLGRISSSIVKLLSGKNKSYYHPGIDIGDYVILINAKTLIAEFPSTQLYVFHPGHPGSSLKKILNRLPQRIIKNSVLRMMPKKQVKRHLLNRLKIYQGPQHPHLAQNPIHIVDIENFTLTY